MKKMLIMIMVLGSCLLVGCGESQSNDTTSEYIIEETFIEETFIEEHFIEEETSEELLRGYGLYTKEYIDELYDNSIEFKVSLKEWRKYENDGYTETEIKYILLRDYGIL